MRYKYNKPIPAGAMLISLNGLYGIKVNPVTQVIVDSKQDNLVINLNANVLGAIESDPNFTCLDQPAEKPPLPVVPEEQLKDTSLPAIKLDRLFKEKAEKKEEEVSAPEKEEEAPVKKTAKRKGRPAKKKTDTES